MSMIPSGTAPGTIVNVSSAPALPGADTSSTGAFFAVGLAQKGPVGVPVTVTNFADFLNLLGARWNSGALYDAAQLYFTVAGSAGIMYVSRVVGPAALAASVTLKNASSVNTLTVSANGPGTYGNSLSVAVIAGPSTIAGSYQLVVSIAGVVVETSPPLVTTTDAVNWGTLRPAASATFSSKYITVTDLGNGQAPAVIAAQALTGGLDDDANAGDTQFSGGLSAFTTNLGPGQVACPGRTTTATLTAVQNHASTFNRFALLDTVNGASASTIAAAAAAQQSAATDPSYSVMLAGWTVWPGSASGTAVPPWNRQIAPSAAAAGLMAASDAVNDCNIAAAGANGFVPGALGVAQSFSATDRATLQAGGVCPFIQDAAGNVKLKGYVTLSIDPRWQDAANARFRMQLIHDAQLIGDQFDFAQVDGAGSVISAFNGALSSNLAGYWAKGSLYGATPSAAYSVDTGPSVNTPATIANRQLNANLSVCMSPSAQWVEIGIIKYLVGQVVPPGSTSTPASASQPGGNG